MKRILYLAFGFYVLCLFGCKLSNPSEEKAAINSTLDWLKVYKNFDNPEHKTRLDSCYKNYVAMQNIDSIRVRKRN